MISNFLHGAGMDGYMGLAYVVPRRQMARVSQAWVMERLIGILLCLKTLNRQRRRRASFSRLMVYWFRMGRLILV